MNGPPSTNEPSGLLIFAIMFGVVLGLIVVISLVGWLRTVVTREWVGRVASAAWRWVFSETRRIVTSEPGRRRPRVLRGARGRLAGSLPSVPAARNEAEHRSTDRSAAESGVPQSTSVPSVPVSVPEAAVIGYKLGQGIAPGEVAKSLPGYRGPRYGEYMEKVNHVRAALAEHAAAKEAAPPPAAREEATATS